MINRIYQFHILLKGIKPDIWRRIVVPEQYTFWDLHVAIQDSMGWLDCHLHAFRFGKWNNRIEIGIPDDDGFGDIEMLPGWHISIDEYFKSVGELCSYEYDFGDGWEHEITLEGIMLKEKRRRYPKCIDGERSCPPEDCGGVPGYYELLEVISNPDNEDYNEMVQWLGKKYEPEYFNPNRIKFDNPKKRWEIAFSDGL